MATLSSQVQRFIIGQLARFHTPTEVKNQVKERFDVEIELSQLGYYDPRTKQGARLSRKWKEFFFEEYERHKKSFDTEIPGANRFYRMRRLQETLDTAVDRLKELLENEMAARNPKFVRDTVLETSKLVRETVVEMEKIMGDVYTNTRKLQGDPVNVLAYLLGVDPADLPRPEE